MPDVSTTTTRRSNLLVLVGLLLAVAAVRLVLGRTVDGDGEVGVRLGIPAGLILELRLSTLAAALVSGAGLGLSGLGFQVLLRNALASPWVLGVSSGAGFGLILAAFLAGLGGPIGAFGSILLLGGGLPAAAGGALLAMLVVAALARRLGGFDPVALVLCGVIVGATFGAGTMLVQHLVPNGVRGDFIGWLMGRVPELVPWWLLVVGASTVLVAVALGGRHARWLDAACLSEDEATSLGVPLGRVRRAVFGTAGLLAAVAVCIVGPIAFVGLLAPHAARLLMGPRHDRLVVASGMCGAGMLVLADVVRQFIDLGGGRVPIGVVTALVGGPLFLLLLLRRSVVR